MTDEITLLPPLKPFVFPSNAIKNDVDSLSMYYQLSHQDAIALYEKWKDKNNFSGTWQDYMKLTDMREMLELAFGKPWEPIVKSIYLIDNHSDKINFKDFHKLTSEQQTEFTKIVSDGLSAHERLVQWLAPINKKDVLEAIYDAMGVKIGNDKYDQFQVLKYGDVKTVSSDDESVGIFPDILEVDTPGSLLEYLKMRPEPMPDCIMLTFMRNKKFRWKPTIYLFLIWHNAMYVLDAGDGRLNIENTEGARDPDRYLDRNFKNVWLPFDILLGNKKQSNTNAISLCETKVFKRGNMHEVFRKTPSISAWLEMFVYRVIDYVKIAADKIPLAYTPAVLKPMLEDKTTKIQERVKIRSDRGEYSSFKSQNDAGSYLVRKFCSDETAIVIKPTDLPDIIGTKEHIENLIQYQSRNQLAKYIQKKLWEDYTRNHRRVYKWWNDFVQSQDPDNLVKTALLDKAYSFMMYAQFGDSWIDGKNVGEFDKPTLMKETVLGTIDRSYKYFGLHKRIGSDLRDVIYTKIDENDYKRDTDVPCSVCSIVKCKKIIDLTFRDYRQILEFFNLSESDIPKEFVDHFHRQNETYVGNNILDDTDPVDEITDPWFRTVGDYSIGFHNSKKRRYAEGEARISIRIPICNRCFRKCGVKDTDDIN